MNPVWNKDNVNVEPECVVVKRILPYVDKDIIERLVKDEIEILRRSEELGVIDTTAEGPKFLPDPPSTRWTLKSSQILPRRTPLHLEQQRRDWPSLLSNVLSALE